MSSSENQDHQRGDGRSQDIEMTPSPISSQDNASPLVIHATGDLRTDNNQSYRVDSSSISTPIDQSSRLLSKGYLHDTDSPNVITQQEIKQMKEAVAVTVGGDSKAGDNNITNRDIYQDVMQIYLDYWHTVLSCICGLAWFTLIIDEVTVSCALFPLFIRLQLTEVNSIILVLFIKVIWKNDSLWCLCSDINLEGSFLHGSNNC